MEKEEGSERGWLLGGLKVVRACRGHRPGHQRWKEGASVGGERGRVWKEELERDLDKVGRES